MDSETFLPVGDPLSPAKAGFLEMELASRGIETRVRFCEPGEGTLPGRQVVEVREADLARALDARVQALGPVPGAAEAAPARKSGSRRTTVLVAAAVGLVAVARLGRLFHVGLRGLLGISAAVALLVVFFFMPAGEETGSRQEPRRKAKP